MRLLTLSPEFFGGQILAYSGVTSATRWIANMFSESGAEVYEFGPLNDESNMSHNLSVSQATSKLVAGQIDAIYCQYIQAGAPFDLAAMSPHVIPVISIGHDLFNGLPHLNAFLASGTRHQSDAVIFSSEAGATAFRKMINFVKLDITSQIEIRVLPLGIEAPQSVNMVCPSNKEVTFLWLGRFSETYKADLRPLLLALQELVKHEGPSVRLILVGSDSSGSADRLREQAKKIDVDRYCSWYPNATDAVREECFAKCDVLVNLSDHVQETFGLVNLEAMVRGLPVITSSWSGFRETVVNGETGFLVPTFLDASLLDVNGIDPFGSVSIAAAVDIPSLVDAMNLLRENRSLRRMMGAAGRKRAEKFYTTNVLGPKYIDFFEERITIARRSKQRNNPRSWMVDVFSHYGTPIKGILKKGEIELNTALELVHSRSLRKAMSFIFENWTEGLPNHPNDLDKIALATLIKLGVLAWSGVNE